MENFERGPSGGFGAFLVCVTVHMMFPLLPLVIEYGLTQNLTPQSLTIAVAMYAMAIGSSSKIRPLFFMMVGTSLLFSAAYGWMLHQDIGSSGLIIPPDSDVAARLKGYSFWVLGGIFTVHAIERFVRHVVNDEAYGVGL